MHRVASRLMPLLLAALAGCSQGDPFFDIPFGSFEEARQAPGTEFEVGPWVLRVVEPADIDNQAMVEQRITIVVWENRSGEPKPELDIRLRARMPAMGHGTTNELDPVPMGDGIYVGRTNFFMPGPWEIILDLYENPVDSHPDTARIPFCVRGEGGPPC